MRKHGIGPHSRATNTNEYAHEQRYGMSVSVVEPAYVKTAIGGKQLDENAAFRKIGASGLQRAQLNTLRPLLQLSPLLTPQNPIIIAITQ